MIRYRANYSDARHQSGKIHVTEHRVWHLESLRHGGSSRFGHEGWHMLGRVVGS